MTQEDYELCQEACKHDGPECYCPPNHEFHSTIANTPTWVRRFFFAKGFQEGVSETEQSLHVVSGDAAKKFLEEMKRTEAGEISPEQRKFLDECSELFNTSKSHSVSREQESGPKREELNEGTRNIE